MGELPILKDENPATRLRGHTLLCLQGFRGLGYSPAFVENLTAISRHLADAPSTQIEVIAGSDAVCAACPHQVESACVLNGPHSEQPMQDQDLDVLGRLGLQPGDRIPWRDILKRIGERLSGEDLPTICGQCRWLSLGYCREGIERLRVAR